MESHVPEYLLCILAALGRYEDVEVSERPKLRAGVKSVGKRGTLEHSVIDAGPIKAGDDLAERLRLNARGPAVSHLERRKLLSDSSGHREAGMEQMAPKKRRQSVVLGHVDERGPVCDAGNGGLERAPTVEIEIDPRAGAQHGCNGIH